MLVFVMETGIFANIGSMSDLKRQVFERDQVCQSCGAKLVWKQNYECCHIVDRASGGSDELENLVAKCYLCSKEKVYAN